MKKILQNKNLTNSSIKGYSKSYIKGLKVKNKECDKLSNSSSSSDLIESTKVIVNV